MRQVAHRWCVGQAAASFCADQRSSSAGENSLADTQIIRPAALRKGGRVGLIAPASSFSREGFLKGCDRLRQMGYEPVYEQDIFERDIYFAGTAERRMRELQNYWQRDDLAALVCVRGGYGANSLLEKLDFDLIAER